MTATTRPDARPARLASLSDHRDRADSPLEALVHDVLRRAGRVTEPVDLAVWARFLDLLDRHRDNPEAGPHRAVLANLLAVVAFDDVTDYAIVTDLADRFGHDRLAALHHRVSRFLEPDPSLPLTTTAVRHLVAPDLRPRLLADPATADRAEGIAEACSRAAVALLFEGVDPDWSLPTIRTVGEFEGWARTGSVVEWRHHLAMVAASPWSPYTRRLTDFARRANLPHAARTIEACIDVCRGRHEERERAIVTAEVRRLVEESGLVQEEYAAWVGLSPARLGAYLSGAGTPPATLLLRMSRTSRSLREQASDGPTERPSRTSVPRGAGRVALTAV